MSARIVEPLTNVFTISARCAYCSTPTKVPARWVRHSNRRVDCEVLTLHWKCEACVKWPRKVTVEMRGRREAEAMYDPDWERLSPSTEQELRQREPWRLGFNQRIVQQQEEIERLRRRLQQRSEGA